MFAIYEPGQFEEVISFLVVGNTRALLFDTGLGIADMRAVAENLMDKPITVLNSHSHYDHIGGNHQSTNIYGVNTAYTAVGSQGLTHDMVSEYVATAWLHPNMSAPGFSPNHYAIKPYAITEFVEDGTRIDLGGRTL